jgi:hypothetical protein
MRGWGGVMGGAGVGMDFQCFFEQSMNTHQLKKEMFASGIWLQLQNQLFKKTKLDIKQIRNDRGP